MVEPSAPAEGGADHLPCLRGAYGVSDADQRSPRRDSGGDIPHFLHLFVQEGVLPVERPAGKVSDGAGTREA